MNETSTLFSMIDSEFILKGIVTYFLLVWFCVVVWVVRDITNRTRSVIYQLLSVALVLVFTPLGICIYLLIRPQKTLFEKIFEEEFLRLESEYRDESKQGSHKDEKKEKKHGVAGMDIIKKK